MSLNKAQLNCFKNELKKASDELESKELTFKSEWTFDLPGQSLEILGQELHHNYQIPIGWDGYGTHDLEELEKLGFLKKFFESEEDPIFLEKIIRYQIIG